MSSSLVCESLDDLRNHGATVPYTTLDLIGKYLGDAKVVEVAHYLKENKTITVVDLSYNNIGDTGATALAEAFRVNSTITVVRLYSNNISESVHKNIDTILKDMDQRKRNKAEFIKNHQQHQQQQEQNKEQEQEQEQ
jgi:hypothetical protein